MALNMMLDIYQTGLIHYDAFGGFLCFYSIYRNIFYHQNNTPV